MQMIECGRHALYAQEGNFGKTCQQGDDILGRRVKKREKAAGVMQLLASLQTFSVLLWSRFHKFLNRANHAANPHLTGQLQHHHLFLLHPFPAWKTIPRRADKITWTLQKSPYYQIKWLPAVTAGPTHCFLSSESVSPSASPCHRSKKIWSRRPQRQFWVLWKLSGQAASLYTVLSTLQHAVMKVYRCVAENEGGRVWRWVQSDPWVLRPSEAEGKEVLGPALTLCFCPTVFCICDVFSIWDHSSCFLMKMADASGCVRMCQGYIRGKSSFTANCHHLQFESLRL